MAQFNGLHYRYVGIICKHKSDLYIANKLGRSTRMVQTYRLSQGIKKKRGFVSTFDFEKMPAAIEDYIGNGMSLNDVSAKHNVSPYKLSIYVSYMFPKRQDETTKSITLQSKV